MSTALASRDAEHAKQLEMLKDAHAAETRELQASRAALADVETQLEKAREELSAFVSESEAKLSA